MGSPKNVPGALVTIFFWAFVVATGQLTYNNEGGGVLTAVAQALPTPRPRVVGVDTLRLPFRSQWPALAGQSSSFAGSRSPSRGRRAARCFNPWYAVQPWRSGAASAVCSVAVCPAVCELVGLLSVKAAHASHPASGQQPVPGGVVGEHAAHRHAPGIPDR